MNNFSAGNTAISVNGREIESWGVTDPPYVEEPINQSGELVQGLGGNAIRMDRENPGMQVTLNILPGTSDSSFLHGLFVSKADITLGKNIIGTLEKAAGSQGVMTNIGTTGRAGGASVSDDVYIIKFNLWDGFKGGND